MKTLSSDVMEKDILKIILFMMIFWTSLDLLQQTNIPLALLKEMLVLAGIRMKYNESSIVFRLPARKIILSFTICFLKLPPKTRTKKNYVCFNRKKLGLLWKNIVPETVKSWRSIFINLKIYSKSTLKILKNGNGILNI